MKKLVLAGSLLINLVSVNSIYGQQLTGTFVGRYTTGVFDEGATEIAAYDKASKKIFSVNGNSGNIDVIDFSNPANPTFLSTLNLSAFGKGANSVATFNGIVACAVENVVKQDNGKVVFFTTAGEFLKSVTVGALPDMLCFTPDGTKVIVANEGEPNDDYSVDPEGSISIIDISGGVANAVVTQLGFTAFNSLEGSLKNNGVRIFGQGANVAKDLEPEYVTVSSDSQTAWVVCQENNAVVIVDLQSNTIRSIESLGFKNHNIAGNGIDASDKNSGNITISTWPVYGMFMPDGIANMTYNNETFIVTANEGDAREYGTFIEPMRVKDLILDSTVFTNQAVLKSDNNLGRLNVSSKMGDIDGDGDIDALYSFGARSFSIWDKDLNLIYDSGDQMEQFLKANFPSNFNSSNSNNTLKNRSDDKGPEPESVITVQIGDSTFAFVGLERMGGVMVYNITNPMNVTFCSYFTSRDFSSAPGPQTAGGDLGPEGILYISGNDSPTGKHYILTSNEISGSIAVYELSGSMVTGISDRTPTTLAAVLTGYPNPTTKGVVHFNKPIAGVLLNTHGKLVKQFDTTTELTVGSYSLGVYFVKATNGEVLKLIIQ